MSILSSDAKVFLPQRNVNLDIYVLSTILVFILLIIIMCLFLLYTRTERHMEYEVGPKELIRKLKADDPDKLRTSKYQFH